MCFGKAFHLILMHFISNIQCFEEFFFKNWLIIFQKFCFSKISINPTYFSINRNCAQKLLWVSVCFDQLKLIFDQSKIVCQVFKKSYLTYSNHFFKTFSNSFFSLRFGQAQSSIFCRFRPNILQGFPLLRPVCPLYPFFFIYFQFFMHWRVIFGLSIFWGFLWFKPFFVKLIIGFLFYDVINMILVV